MVVHAYSPWNSGGWGERIIWAKEVKAAVSCDCATALCPGWNSETLSQNRKTPPESLELTLPDLRKF